MDVAAAFPDEWILRILSEIPNTVSLSLSLELYSL